MGGHPLSICWWFKLHGFHLVIYWGLLISRDENCYYCISSFFPLLRRSVVFNLYSTNANANYHLAHKYQFNFHSSNWTVSTTVQTMLNCCHLIYEWLEFIFNCTTFCEKHINWFKLWNIWMFSNKYHALKFP